MRNLPKGSDFWNFISKCRGIISKYLTWDVAVGDKALFWEDSWDGHPPIHASSSLEYLITKLKSLWGNKIKDYKVKKMSDGELSWEWKSLDGLDLAPDSVAAFEKILSSRNIK